jgi:hypothetical protein
MGAGVRSELIWINPGRRRGTILAQSMEEFGLAMGWAARYDRRLSARNGPVT